jgi:hypothetical protein
MEFYKVRGANGNIREDLILYKDDNGVKWNVPNVHRIWKDVYLPWVAAGNKPKEPDTSDNRRGQ